MSNDKQQDDDERIQLARRVTELVDDENWEELATHLDHHFAHHGRPPDNGAADHDMVLPACYELYVQALVHLEQYDKAVLFVENDVPAHLQERLRPLQQYAYYRHEQYEQILTQRLDNDDDPSALHLRAQSMYHVAQTHDAVAELEKIWKHQSSNVHSNGALAQQVATNMLAACVANATPFCPNDDDIISPDMRHEIDALLAADNVSYDLLHNAALLTLIQQPSAAAQQNLQRAYTCGLQQEEEDHERALAALVTNQAWVQQWWNGQVAVTGMAAVPAAPAHVKQVRAANRAACMPRAADAVRLMPVVPSMTPLQYRLWCYNRAVLYLRAENADASLQVCDELLASLTGSAKTASLSSKKKTKGAAAAAAAATVPHHLPPASDAGRWWWQARVAVVQAYCYELQDDDAKAADTLTKTLTELDQQMSPPVSLVRDHAMLYVQTHQAALQEKDDDVMAVLDTLPGTLQHCPAALASKVAMYEQRGQHDLVRDVLSQLNDDLAVASYAMAQGKYAEAVQLYEQLLASRGDDFATRARLVQALSHVDPARTVQAWSDLQAKMALPDDDAGADFVDVVALEERELPRLKSTKKARHPETDLAAAPSVEATNHAHPKRSHDAILRRRTKLRELHLQKLQSQGLYYPDRPAQPDPERWLPKYERSYNRRRRNRNANAHRGALGGVSAKDAAKLDVYARQAARASGADEASGAASTAHVKAVSSGGGRRGRKKS